MAMSVISWNSLCRIIFLQLDLTKRFTRRQYNNNVFNCLSRTQQYLTMRDNYFPQMSKIPTFVHKVQRKLLIPTHYANILANHHHPWTTSPSSSSGTIELQLPIREIINFERTLANDLHKCSEFRSSSFSSVVCLILIIHQSDRQTDQGSI